VLPGGFGPGARLLSVTPELRTQLSAALCENVAPIVKTWRGPAQLLESFREEVDGLLERAHNRELAQEYARYFPIAGAAADDYRNLIVELPFDLRVITGIRFKGLDLHAPFVDVAWQSRALRDEQELREVARRIAQAYAVMKPRYAQFRSHACAAFDPAACPGVRPDRHVVAGLVKTVAQTQIPLSDGVALVSAQPSELYDEYLADYAAFHAQQPTLVDAAQPERLASLVECFEQGTFFRVLVSGAPAGVVALRRDTCEGLDGYCVVELLLAAAFRGRGLAAAVHVHVCQQAVMNGERALFGSIAARNLPSLRAAQRVGRQIVSTKLVVPLEAAS
jgi:hypothetical protein